jgi:hypothetical protein
MLSPVTENVDGVVARTSTLFGPFASAMPSTVNESFKDVVSLVHASLSRHAGVSRFYNDFISRTFPLMSRLMRAQAGAFTARVVSKPSSSQEEPKRKAATDGQDQEMPMAHDFVPVQERKTKSAPVAASSASSSSAARPAQAIPSVVSVAEGEEDMGGAEEEEAEEDVVDVRGKKTGEGKRKKRRRTEGGDDAATASPSGEAAATKKKKKKQKDKENDKTTERLKVEPHDFSASASILDARPDNNEETARKKKRSKKAKATGDVAQQQRQGQGPSEFGRAPRSLSAPKAGNLSRSFVK